MNVKKALTIGLLSIATIGLIGCAITFNKKQKTQQTNAEYYFDMISDTDNYTDITIKGTLENNNLPTLEEGETFWLLQGNYTLYIYKFNPNPRIALYLKPTTINRLTFDSVDTIQQEEDVYFSQNMPNETGFNFGAHDLQQKDIKDITIKQTKLDYYPQTYCYISMSIQVRYTDNTITNTSFTDYQIPNNYIIEDVFELDFTDTNIYTKDRIQISNTLNAINQYTQDRYAEGYQNGETQGYQTGYTEGEQAGYTQGHEEGYEEGEYNGYQEGWNDNDSFSAPIDIRGLMLNILTMPFTFIRQAFNVTMWEGTPYQFNVTNFILALIAIATILFIIRLFTSGFSVIGNYTNSKENRAERQSRIELNKAKTRRENNLADKGK